MNFNTAKSLGQRWKSFILLVVVLSGILVGCTPPPPPSPSQTSTPTATKPVAQPTPTSRPTPIPSPTPSHASSFTSTSSPEEIIIWLFEGVIAGLLASIALRRHRYGITGDLIIGLIGAFIAGFLISLFVSGLFGLIGSMIIAFIGSWLLLCSLRFIPWSTEQSKGDLASHYESQMVPPVQKKGWTYPGEGYSPVPTHFSAPRISLFISHSSKDDDFGRRLVQDLRKALGSDEAVWYDSEGGLYGGEAWWSRIVSVVAACDVFLIILSPSSMNSKWVIKELDIAIVEGKRIIPILYRQCDIRPDLRAMQVISFFEPISYEVAFIRLLEALRH